MPVGRGSGVELGYFVLSPVSLASRDQDSCSLLGTDNVRGQMTYLTYASSSTREKRAALWFL